ncbi:thiaminase II [Bifidobacterium criceti]|uniref:Aminopyrimidine aminohydrolase n=1 Tax=Bifidobacterium criceti TaxID=1960969 RepID=A0A2A2EG40_9BIFI|nr:thiaminase II [Bifidobacterium criceti]PAU68159.1 TenA family transcriptional regulator [Bifidobacterium criceti]
MTTEQSHHATGITLTNLPPFARRMRDAADLVWEEGYRQPFIRELGAGTLPTHKFAFYLKQDELYLNDYAKVHALALTKTDDADIMKFMVGVQRAIFDVEKSLHNDYLASYGITSEDMRQARQSAFARAYTTHMLAIAYGGDLLDVLVAVLPCAWVYADYGQRLAAEFADTLADNPYKSWIDTYKTDEFWQSSVWLIEHIEQLAAHVDDAKRDELVELFIHGVENEYMFWSSAYDEQMSWKPQWIALDAS